MYTANSPAPISGALISKMVITRIHNGRLGWRADAQFPQATGSAGSIFDLDLNIGRNYTHEGRKTSLLTASCTDNDLKTHLQIGFEDGTSEETTLTQACSAGG